MGGEVDMPKGGEGEWKWEGEGGRIDRDRFQEGEMEKICAITYGEF